MLGGEPGKKEHKEAIWKKIWSLDREDSAQEDVDGIFKTGAAEILGSEVLLKVKGDLIVCKAC